MIDQLPTDPVGIEIANHGPRRAWTAGFAVCDTGDLSDGLTGLQRAHQSPQGLLAFAAHDRGGVGFLAQDFSASDRSGRPRHRRSIRVAPPLRSPATSVDNGMARGRAGVAEQYGIRIKAECLGDDFLRRHWPNSASISRTWWPSSIRGPPMASKPSGGRWSSGIRLPIEGCGTFTGKMRMIAGSLWPQRLGSGSSAREFRPPKRRSRRWKYTSASSRSCASNSGHIRSVKCSSA